MDVNKAYYELIKMAEELRFDEIATHKEFLITFSSMSNIDSYYNKYRAQIEHLSYDILENLIISLSDCGNKFYRGFLEDRYFMNHFSQIFGVILRRRLTQYEQKNLIDPLLNNRHNAMMPFGVIVPLEIKNTKDLKKWKAKVNANINLTCMN